MSSICTVFRFRMWISLKWRDILSASERLYRFSYLAICPAKLNFVHAPEFMDVLCQLIAHIFKMWRQNNLTNLKMRVISFDVSTHFVFSKYNRKRLDGNEKVFKVRWFVVCHCCMSHLAGNDWGGNEGCLRQELSGSQQVSHSLQISFILLHRLHPHLFFGEKSFITRCIASRGQELEVTMATTQ